MIRISAAALVVLVGSIGVSPDTEAPFCRIATPGAQVELTRPVAIRSRLASAWWTTRSGAVAEKRRSFRPRP